MRDQKNTVMIIDDEEDLRDTAEYSLKSTGFDVITAVDGIDALEKLEKANPDLIILDMNMPRMNGLEFYKNITDEQDMPKYPVLVLTARANMEKLFRELDVDGFMTKPFELKSLIEEVNAIIEKKRSIISSSGSIEDARAARVCVVDQDSEVLRKASQVFLSAGYMVCTANKASFGIKRISMDVPDVAVISMDLSDVSGDVVVGKLYRLDKTKHIKYILYTDKPADIDKSIVIQKLSEKDGIGSFLQTNEPHELLKAVRSVLKSV